MAFGRAKPVARSVAHKLGAVPSTALEKEASADKKSKKSESDYLYEIKDKVRLSLVEILDVQHINELSPDKARGEIEVIAREVLSQNEPGIPATLADKIVDSLVDDVLGFGPLQPLLAVDEISDIMVNGPHKVFIEINGKIQQTDIHFKDEQHLLNVCQRIVSLVGRRVDESSPMCDARLADGSRVNVIVPPLAIDGSTLTIRKFRKKKLSLNDLVGFGTLTVEGAEILSVIAQCRCNLIVSGGTGSGKTSLLNCLTAFFDSDERIVTCEDAAELQLQQEHVIRLETRPPNLEREGEILMRDLVRNCLRMRPDRIIVGEVRSSEAFDLLQAMNTGHDGSMGTVHANSPRDGLRRLETMVSAAGLSLPVRNLREMIGTSVEIIVQVARLRDGRRVVTNITEVTGMEEDVITTQDLYFYEISGEDSNGKIIGRHMGTGVIRPKFWERAKYYGQSERLSSALSALETKADV